MKEARQKLGGGTEAVKHEIAPLQHGLPIGPVLVITGGYSIEDTIAQKEKNDAEIASTREVQTD